MIFPHLKTKNKKNDILEENTLSSRVNIPEDCGTEIENSCDSQEGLKRTQPLHKITSSNCADYCCSGPNWICNPWLKKQKIVKAIIKRTLRWVRWVCDREFWVSHMQQKSKKKKKHKKKKVSPHAAKEEKKNRNTKKKKVSLVISAQAVAYWLLVSDMGVHEFQHECSSKK